MRSVMAHNFSQVPQAEIPRSSFNRSHGYKTTFDAGYLVPFFVDEALPGDTFNLKVTTFCRLSTPIVPVMDNMFMETFFFAVPYRLIWNNFHKFMGAQDNPGDSTSYVCPQMVAPGAPGILVGSLSDYMGLPTGIAGYTFNSFHHRAYNLIWNEFFRDENLQNSVTVDKGDGPDTYTNYVLKRRGKRHDYFTSCLPWPQKGTAVTIPLGTTAPVTLTTANANNIVGRFQTDHSTIFANRTLTTDANGYMKDSGSSVLGVWDPNGTLVTNLASASAATIASLRQAFQIQKLYERDARGGTRLTEIIRAHFGVTSPDARLQRPEYLGGGSSQISFTPVPQTSSTDVVTPQGKLAAYAVGTSHGHGFTKSFTEHCVLIGLVNVRADLNYQQGLNRMFSRTTRWDFYWPALSGIGEQAVLNKEIYMQASPANDTANAAAFGYQERFAEYRYKPSQITGKFRSTYSTPLDIWHLAQNFSALPTLNSTFIEDTPPVSRILAVNTEPHILFDAYFDMKCARPMPVYGVPGNIDRF